MLSISLAAGVELRLLEHRHAEELFALIDQNHAFLRRWLPEADVQKTLGECQALIRSSLEQLAENAGFMMGIWAEGSLAGVVGAGRIDWDNHSTLMGYWLGEIYQDRGLVTRACRAVIDYLFGELKLRRVEIRCAADNPRSCAVPRRLGFKQEGILRQAQALDDRYLDIEVWGLLAEEWETGTG